MSSINAAFLISTERFLLKQKSAIQAVTKQVLLEIAYRLEDYSPLGDPSLWKSKYWPKGYNPGHFKMNWQLGVDEMPVGEISGEDPSGEIALERMRKAIPRWPVGHKYYFVNNVPYARILEDGTHSTQVPPGGMVGRVVIEFPQILRKAEIDYSRNS